MALEPGKISEGVVWEAFGTILLESAQERPGVVSIDFTKVLAIQLAQGVVRRHCATREGETDVRVQRPPDIVICETSASSSYKSASQELGEIPAVRKRT